MPMFSYVEQKRGVKARARTFRRTHVCARGIHLLPWPGFSAFGFETPDPDGAQIPRGGTEGILRDSVI